MTAIYGALPASERDTTVIVSSDYGVVGALQVFGNPDSSPQLQPAAERLPLAAGASLRNRRAHGRYAPSDVASICTSARVVAHLTVPYHVVNLEQGSP